MHVEHVGNDLEMEMGGPVTVFVRLTKDRDLIPAPLFRDRDGGAARGIEPADTAKATGRAQGACKLERFRTILNWIIGNVPRMPKAWQSISDSICSKTALKFCGGLRQAFNLCPILGFQC